MEGHVKEKKRLLMIDNIAVESARRSVYRELARCGEFDVDLLLPESWMEQGEPTVCEPEEANGIRVHTTPFLLGYRQHRVLYTKLCSVIRKVRPHFLYIDSEPENYASLECCLCRRLISPKTRLGLVSSRNLDYRSIGFPYKLEFTHRWCDSIIRGQRADVVFVRPGSAIPLMEAYARSVCQLPHAVDCTTFRRTASGSGRAADGKLVLGFLGRIVESKGVRLLIQALPHLPENMCVRLVGKGPLVQPLQKLAADLGVADRVEICPAVDYRHVPGVLNAMDMLVLPSMETTYWTEQFGRVLIEAMACELPIVASRSGEIPEVLGEAGVLFRMGDLADLIEKVRSLVQNAALRNELAEKGRGRALRLFDAPVIAQRVSSAILQSLEIH